MTADPVSRGGTEEAPPPATDWIGEGLRFTCHRCGRCCTGSPGEVALDEAEIAALAAHLGLTERRFLKRFARRLDGRWALRETKTARGRDCVFLTFDEEGLAGCSVYALRPRQCRTYPFWPSVLESVRSWAEEARSCRGIKEGLAGEGEIVPTAEIEHRCGRSAGL